MKCPYRNFEDCLVELCPSCNYKEIQSKAVYGGAPLWMSTEEAIRRGIAWEGIRTTYEFVSCKLIDGGVQPIPSTKQVINNNTSTNVVVRKSVF